MDSRSGIRPRGARARIRLRHERKHGERHDDPTGGDNRRRRFQFIVRADGDPEPGCSGFAGFSGFAQQFGHRRSGALNGHGMNDKRGAPVRRGADAI
jgi:hypothetical protein